MKIGYIVLCHKDPTLVARIVNKVTIGTNNIAIIHVDQKYDDKPFKQLLNDNKQAYFLEERVKVYWGGFSSIEATINSLKKGIFFGCDRFVLLQGSDYPIFTNQYINTFFEKQSGIEFLRGYNITKSKKTYNYMKCHGYHIYDGINRNEKNIKTLLVRVLSFFNKFGIKYRKGYFESNNLGRYDIYWGWGHFALTIQCVQYIVEFYEKNKDFNKYFKHIFPADETYIHTIIFNSTFASNTKDHGSVNDLQHQTVQSMLNLTYFEYPKHVKIISKIEDYSKLRDSGCLFFRKISGENTELLDFIDSLDGYTKLEF